MRYNTWDVATTNDFVDWFDDVIGFRGGKKPPMKCEVQNCKLVDVRIKNVIFNYPATIVFWMDGTKTVVKCGENDFFDPEKGLAMAIVKKVMANNKGNYNNIFRKWIKEEDY